MGAKTSVSLNLTNTSKEFNVWRGCKVTCIVARDSEVHLVFFFSSLREVEDDFSTADDTLVVGITTFALVGGGGSICITTLATGCVEV